MSYNFGLWDTVLGEGKVLNVGWSYSVMNDVIRFWVKGYGSG